MVFIIPTPKLIVPMTTLAACEAPNNDSDAIEPVPARVERIITGIAMFTSYLDTIVWDFE